MDEELPEQVQDTNEQSKMLKDNLKQHKEILKGMDNLCENIKKEKEIVKNIISRIVHPITLFKHKDLATLMKDVEKKTNHILKLEEKINSTKKPLEDKDKEKLEKEIHEDLNKIDKDFAISLFTTTYIIRSIAAYYKTRLKTAGVMNEDPKVEEEFHHIVEDLEKTVRWGTALTAQGDLPKATEALGHALETKGVKFNRLFVGKTTGKKLADEL